MNAAAWQRGLYLITPEDADTARLLARVGAVLREASLLQYRNKAADAALRTQQAHALVELCRNAGVPMIVNDDTALAHATGADGVHLGDDDGDPASARALLGAAAIIGVSCYNDIARARAAELAGADYVAFGAFHPSPTKPLARRAGLQMLARDAGIKVPKVAIGGITPDNAGTLVDAGADLLAVISAVFDAPDPPAAARALRGAFD